MTGRSFTLTRGPIVVAVLAAAACSPAVEAKRPAAEYDQQTGRLRRLTLDINQNGRTDAISVMDGTRIDYIESDLDEDGKTDRWDFYRGRSTLAQVGFSRLNDGVMDSRVTYAPDDTVVRIELSTRRDGRFNRVEFYEGGRLVRSEEDTNGDGRPDKWETYRPNTGAAPGDPPYVVVSVAFDDSGRGAPERRVTYDESGRIRVETYPAAVSAGVAQPEDR